MTEQEADRMDFNEVCKVLRIAPTSYNFAKAYREGLVNQRVWVMKFLVSNMVLAVACDELSVKIGVLLDRLGEADS